MHTRNVNVRTAAQESSRKMGDKPEHSEETQMDHNTANVALMTFFIPSHNAVYDWARQKTDGEWVTRFGWQTLVDVRSRYPDVELMPFVKVQKIPDIGFISGWKEITQARYVDQMGSLPLMDWSQGQGGESFKSMEFSGGDVTAIFVRYAGRFFECRDLYIREHTALVGDVINRFCLDIPLPELAALR
ncbi:hypothetical protein [Leclercia adecarboxylata]|uniref:hypothetical protein n=1 Tax=Leclercia adecarboxylata TaxID=83655 RepID=UPI001E659202|nr:hypothetical protein [Leclercia adecarboxylata]